MVSPSKSRAHPRDLTKGAGANELVKSVRQRPREVISVLICGRAKQIKVASDHKWEGASFDFVRDFVQEDRGKGVIRRAVNNHEFPKHVELTVKDHIAGPEDAMIESHKIKTIALRTYQNATRVARRGKKIPVKAIGTRNRRELVVREGGFEGLN